MSLENKDEEIKNMKNEKKENEKVIKDLEEGKPLKVLAASDIHGDTDLAEKLAKQAEDEGIWFIAETAPEAYLQKELRKLHRIIEEEFGPPKYKPRDHGISEECVHMPIFIMKKEN